MTYDNPPENEGWTVHRVGQGILLDGESVLLCANRWFSRKPLVWTLPGGRAEEGEGIIGAAIRELKEETGLDVEAGPLAFVAEARSAVRKQIFLTCAYLVSRKGGELQAGADSGVEELRFVPFSQLADYLQSPSLGQPLVWYLQHRDEGARYWFYPEYTSD